MPLSRNQCRDHAVQARLKLTSRAHYMRMVNFSLDVTVDHNLGNLAHPHTVAFGFHA